MDAIVDIYDSDLHKFRSDTSEIIFSVLDISLDIKALNLKLVCQQNYAGFYVR